MYALSAIWNQVAALATTTEASMLVIAVLIMVAAGLLTPRPSALGTSTLAALLVFALAYFGKAVGAGNSAISVAGDHWDKFLAMPTLMILSYAIIFAVPITIVHLVRKLIFLR